MLMLMLVGLATECNDIDVRHKFFFGLLALRKINQARIARCGVFYANMSSTSHLHLSATLLGGETYMTFLNTHSLHVYIFVLRKERHDLITLGRFSYLHHFPADVWQTYDGAYEDEFSLLKLSPPLTYLI